MSFSTGLRVICRRAERAGVKNWNDGLPGRKRSFTISSVIWIQYTNVTDGRTLDRHRPTAEPHLRLAARGKKERAVQRAAARGPPGQRETPSEWRWT